MSVTNGQNSWKSIQNRHVQGLKCNRNFTSPNLKGLLTCEIASTIGNCEGLVWKQLQHIYGPKVFNKVAQYKTKVQVDLMQHHETHWSQTVYTEVIVSIKATTAVTNELVPPHCFTLYSYSSEPWLIEMELILSSFLDVGMVFHKPVFPSGVCIRGANEKQFTIIRLYMSNMNNKQITSLLSIQSLASALLWHQPYLGCIQQCNRRKMDFSLTSVGLLHWWYY